MLSPFLVSDIDGLDLVMKIAWMDNVIAQWRLLVVNRFLGPVSLGVAVLMSPQSEKMFIAKVRATSG